MINHDSFIINNTVLRVEEKYIISRAEYENLRVLLSALMHRDPHCNSQTGSYCIRSLYFDTPNNKDYEDGIVGVEQRKKVRMRIYDFSTKVVNFEIKIKKGSYSRKLTRIISYEECNKLINGNEGALRGASIINDEKGVLELDWARYEPRILIDYEREAFLYPFQSVRITFDKEIKAQESDHLFSKELLMIPLFDLNQIVMEVKYERYLPRILADAISGSTALRQSISKYCMCRTMLGV